MFIKKSPVRSKVLCTLSSLGLLFGAIAQPVYSQPSFSTSQSIQIASKPKSDQQYKIEFDRRGDYLEKHCKWNNYKYKNINYRICAMEDIIMAVSMDGPPNTGDNGPTFYRYLGTGTNSFSFRDTGLGTAVIIEKGRLVAEVEVGRSSNSTVKTRFTAQERKELTDRALSSRKHLESVAYQWQRAPR